MSLPALYTDETLMPFGKYKGHKLANVPAAYLYWLYYGKNIQGRLRDYIESNHQAIIQEMKKHNQ